MISHSYLPRQFQELSRKGTFSWFRTDEGLPKVAFSPEDPADKNTAFEAELFIENSLGGELERFAKAACEMRKADRSPNAGSPGTDRDPRSGHVDVRGERNEFWDGAIRSSSGGQFDGTLTFSPSSRGGALAKAFGLSGVEEMKTHVGFHHFPGYFSESMELIENSSREISIKVSSSGPDGPGAESHVYRVGSRGQLVIEDASRLGGKQSW